MNWLKYFAFISTVFIFLNSLSAEILNVYYPTFIPINDRQDSGKREGVPNIIFGQYRDFIENVKSTNPPYVIATSWFGRSNPNYKAKFQFIENGKKEELYKVIALDRKWTNANLAQARIGILEEFDRSQFSPVVKELTGSNFNVIKSVSKPENILTMLVFKTVDVVIIAESILDSVKKMHSFDLITIKTSKPVAKPILYGRVGSEAKELKKIDQLPKPFIASLGFSGFKEAKEESLKPLIISESPLPLAQNEAGQKTILVFRPPSEYFKNVETVIQQNLTSINFREILVTKDFNFRNFNQQCVRQKPTCFCSMIIKLLALLKK